MTDSRTLPAREEIERATGRGVRILVADSGVETDHPALEGAAIRCWRVEPGPDGRAAVVEDAGEDVFGHGTAVASILRRWAPDAEIHSLRILGGTLRGASEVVLAGLAWGVRQGYDLVGCSFGTSSREHLAGYKHLVDAAFCANVWLVGACNNTDFRREEYPAFFPSVLATDFADLPGLALRRRRDHVVEFCAAGVHLDVPWRGGGRRIVMGSSFAAPHVTALAARLRELRPTWNVCQAKAALYAWAEGGAAGGGGPPA